MNKNSFFLLVLLMSVVLSCRTETELLEEDSRAKKFAVFTDQNMYSKSGMQVDYAKGFAYLAQRYDSIHSTNITGLVSSNNKVNFDGKVQQRFIDESTEAYIEFRIHSQLVEEDNGDKWIVYPKIQNKTVSGLVVAALMEDGTIAGYHNIGSDSEFYQLNTSLFQEKYDEHFLTDNKNKIYITFENARCGFNGEEACEIDAVVIKKPMTLSAEIFHDFFDFRDWEFYGECPEYEACSDGGGGSGGGGGNSNDTDNNNDPCERIKNKIKLAKFKDNIEDLETKFHYDHETGYRLDYPNEGEAEIKSQMIENKIGTRDLNYSYSENTFAFMHNHYDGQYPIFSPRDIIQFNKWLVWAQAYNQNINNTKKIDLTNLAFVLVTNYGNYVLYFDANTVSALPEYDIDALNRKYEDDYLINAVSVNNVSNESVINKEILEEQFLKFLNDHMSFTGLKLYDIGEDNDGTSTQILLDSNGDRDTKDCEEEFSINI